MKAWTTGCAALALGLSTFAGSGVSATEQPVAPKVEALPTPDPAPQQKEPPAGLPPAPSAVPTPDKQPAPPQKEPPTIPDAPITPTKLSKPAPETAPSDEKEEFPTPTELIEKLKKMHEKEASLPKVALLDLTMPVLEKPAGFSLFTDTTIYTLRAWIDRLHAARDDKDCRGVLVTLGSGTSLNLAQAQELRDALAELRKAGKKSFVYADTFDTVGYTIASGATDVCLLEGGELMIPGVGMEAMFVKGLFDKLGVEAEYIQIGEYKGANEEYTRTEASKELRGELTKLTDDMYEQLVDDISHNRNISRDAVKALIDETIVSAAVAKQRGLVDHLVDVDGMRKLIGDELGNAEINLVSNYGMPQRQAMDFSNPFALLGSLMSKPPTAATRQSVAIVYAQGVIADGEGGDGIFSEEGVASDDMRKSLRLAARDPNIKAIVLRIDSPGGSALASEAIWQSVRRLAKDKPVIISVGGMAASGGYYIASAGDYIFADPSAIVGSIGVVGGKFVIKDLYEKLGVHTEAFKAGRNAGLFSMNTPWDERQKRMVTTWMRGTYDQFTQRVMTTRAGKIKDIDQVARGRIFVARQAKELGMIDEIGGVQSAITFAAGKAGMQPGSFDVRVVPQPRTIADLLGGGAGAAANGAADAPDPEDTLNKLRPSIRIDGDSMLRALSPELRRTLGRQLQTMQLLQERPVILMSPYVVTLK